MKCRFVFVGPVSNLDIKSGPEQVMDKIYLEFKRSGLAAKVVNSRIHSLNAVLDFVNSLLYILTAKDVVINVHSNGLLLPIFFAYLSRLDRKNDYFLTLHGVSAMDEERQTLKNKVMEKLLVKVFKNIICVSKLQRDVLSSKYQRYSRVYVIYNGVAGAEAVNSKVVNDDVAIISAGGFSQTKMTMFHVDVARQLSLLLGPDRKVKLDVYGPIRDEEMYSLFMDGVNRKDNLVINYKGTVPSEKLMSLYSRYDYCICFSKWETFNQTALQAMIRKVPAIVSTTTGVCELIAHGVDGYVFSISDSPEEVARRIVQDMGSYEIISESAYECAKKYLWSDVSDRYLSLMGD